MASPSRSALLEAIAAKLAALPGFVEADEVDPGKMSMYLATQSARVGFSLDMPGGVADKLRQNKRVEMAEVVDVSLMVDVRQHNKRESAQLGMDTEDIVIGALLGGLPGWGVYYDSSARTEAKSGAMRQIDMSFEVRAAVNFGVT